MHWVRYFYYVFYVSVSGPIHTEYQRQVPSVDASIGYIVRYDTIYTKL